MAHLERAVLFSKHKINITLNRPEKFNAFNIDMYTELREELDLAAKDPSAVVTVITGAGQSSSSSSSSSS